MKIAICGAGNVGGALGKRWQMTGHQVVYGVPDPEKERLSIAGPEQKPADVRTVAAAVRGADVIVLATPWPEATQDAIAQCGDLNGKLLVDVTNPLKKDFSGLEFADGRSGASQVASWAPGAKVFKTFNQTGWENMAQPQYPKRPVMFACGPDAEHKATVLGLIEDVGFEAVYAGDLESASLLESLGMLWIRLSQTQLGRNFAFQIEHRDEVIA